MMEGVHRAMAARIVNLEGVLASSVPLGAAKVGTVLGLM
jgi:hypothetical protein